MKTTTFLRVVFANNRNGDPGVTLMIKEFMGTRQTLPKKYMASHSLLLQIHLLHCCLTHTGTATICHSVASLGRHHIWIVDLNLEYYWHPETTDICAALTVLIRTLAS